MRVWLNPCIGMRGLAVEATLLSGRGKGELDLVKALGVPLSILHPDPLWRIVPVEASILLSKCFYGDGPLGGPLPGLW